MTGTKFDNRSEGLDAAFRFCSTNRGLVEYLFVQRWDRLGRDVSGCLEAIKRFRQIGVEVNCPEKWVDYDDPHHIILLTLDFAIAQSESAKISERTINGQHAAREEGYWPARVPTGYLRNADPNASGKEAKVRLVDPVRGPIIRLCFERHAAGESKADLFKEFKKVLGVSRSHFFRMFQNPYYQGDIYVKAYKNSPAKIIPGRHEAIVSREVWARCQEVRQEAEPPALGKTWYTTQSDYEELYYLKGILRGVDGSFMRAYKSRSKTGKYHHYYADRYTGKTVPITRAHHITAQAIGGMRLLPEVTAEVRKAVERQINEQMRAATKAISEAETAIERAKSRIERVADQYADGEIHASEYKRLVTKFERDVLTWSAELEKGQAKARSIDGLVQKALGLLEQIDTVFAASQGEYKKRILRALFPEGVFVDAKAGILRTPRMNANLQEIYSLSSENKFLQIGNYHPFGENHVEGGQRDTLRTPQLIDNEQIAKDRILIAALFAA